MVWFGLVWFDLVWFSASVASLFPPMFHYYIPGLLKEGGRGISNREQVFAHVLPITKSLIGNSDVYLYS